MKILFGAAIAACFSFCSFGGDSADSNAGATLAANGRVLTTISNRIGADSPDDKENYEKIKNEATPFIIA